MSPGEFRYNSTVDFLPILLYDPSMKQTPKQVQQTKVQLKSLQSSFASLRQMTNSFNEVERLNVIRKQLGMKLVPVK
jgi:hypothetical protein